MIKYIKLFDTFKSEKDLSQDGLFARDVKIKDCEILNKYKDLLENPNIGTIGWNYPNSASAFDMNIELPVQFKKIDGSDLTLGIGFEYLELIK